MFQDQLPLETMLKRVRYERLPKPELPAALAKTLPQNYVAMRFYFRPSFPDTPHNRDFVKKLAGRIAKTMPIMLLNTGLQVDDHTDCSWGASLSLEGHVTATDNLDVQGRVIANAQAFVGTYGGLSYLAPFFGVPSIGCYSDTADLKFSHFCAMREACRRIAGQFIELHVDDIELLNKVGILAPRGE